MRNIFRMDLYRLRKSKFFIGCIIFILAFTMVVTIVTPLLTNAVASIAGQPAVAPQAMNFSDILANPFVMFIPLVIFISAVSFSYLDFSGGYIKSIAGQARSRSELITSKFITIAIHNLILMIAALLGFTLGILITSPIVFDAAIMAGLGDFFLKWLLITAITSILLFFSSGVRVKALAIILAVVIGSGMLSLAYMGINSAVGATGIQNFDITHFVPSQLMNNVSVVNSTLVANALIVSIVTIVLFYVLTVILFKKRDIK